MVYRYSRTTLKLLIIGLVLLVSIAALFWFKQQTKPNTPVTIPADAGGPIAPLPPAEQKTESDSALIRTSNTEAVVAAAQAKNIEVIQVQRLADGESLVILSAAADTPAVTSIANSVPGSQAGPRVAYRALATPNDPFYSGQWHTTKISAPAAWDMTIGSGGVTVAVIDTGYYLDHEDLINRWAVNSGESGGGKETNAIDDDGNGKIDDWRGWDFVGTAPFFTPDNNPNTASINHGTEVAGLIGAETNNSKGVAGVDWSARLLPLRVLDDDGSGWTEDVAAAMAYARSLGVKVINLSLGSTEPDPLLEAEINAAINAGITVVAAAGNCGNPATYGTTNCDNVGQIVYPANYPSVIAVGATDINDTRAGFSSYGANLDVMAPGSGAIRAPIVNNGYSTTLSGTSFASPIVAGVATLIKARFPDFTPSQVSSALVNYADKVGAMAGQNRTDQYGYGRINAYISLLRSSNYSWQVVTQNTYDNASKSTWADSANLLPGEKVYALIQARNTGNVAWQNSGLGAVRLGTSRPQDRASSFCDTASSPAWPTCNRPAQMLEATVTPGAVGTFEFWYTAGTRGAYREYFNLVAEGLSWMSDIGLHFNTTVTFPTAGAISSQNANQSLNAGQSLTSADGRYQLIMQTDGNLVLYSINRPLWHSRTHGTPANRVVMQDDGNLVVYDGQNRPYWWSGTHGRGSSSLRLQTDGNLVIYDSSNRPIWASYTHGQL